MFFACFRPYVGQPDKVKPHHLLLTQRPITEIFAKEYLQFVFLKTSVFLQSAILIFDFQKNNCFALSPWKNHELCDRINKTQFLWILKFIYSEKATKFWENLHLRFDSVWERSLMTSHGFLPFLTYLPTLSYSITSLFWGNLGPPYLPQIWDVINEGSLLYSTQ